jgi:hypothetical protein
LHYLWSEEFGKPVAYGATRDGGKVMSRTIQIVCLHLHHNALVIHSIR